jgi:exodeoxyribonuclease-1
VRTLAAFQNQVDELAEQAMERGDERAEHLLGELMDYAEGLTEGW